MLFLLCFWRRLGERIRIGDDIWVHVYEMRRNGEVRIAIDAPKHIRVDREEVAVQRDANRKEPQ